MLREQKDPLSGAAMSKTLGITRSAVWKHIRSLRREGYRIEARPARGYRLVAVPPHPTQWEIQAGLGTEQFGTIIYALPQVDSTNEVAFRLALNGAQEGTVVVAESQAKGKGRVGRRWESPSAVAWASTGRCESRRSRRKCPAQTRTRPPRTAFVDRLSESPTTGNDRSATPCSGRVPRSWSHCHRRGQCCLSVQSTPARLLHPLAIPSTASDSATGLGRAWGGLWAPRR